MAIQHAIGGAASVSSIRHNLAAQVTPSQDGFRPREL
jgi:hypothetical protein